MNNEPLAPIFLNNKAIAMKDPKPKVSAVLSAGGQDGVTQVRWLQAQSSTQGTLLRADQTLDRTSEPSKAIYLTSASASTATTAVKAPIIDEEIVSRPFAGTRPKPGAKTAHDVDEADEAADAQTDTSDESTDDPAADEASTDDDASDDGSKSSKNDD